MPFLGFAQVVEVFYQQNITAELNQQQNITVRFLSNDSRILEYGFGNPDNWLNVTESSFILDLATMPEHNLTIGIFATTDLGVFVRRVPYTVSWDGGMASHNLTFLISTIPPQTTIDVTSFINEFEIPIFTEQLGVLKVYVNNTIPAWNITFSDSMNWTTFEKQLITIQANDSEAISFKIKPNITRTEQTNTTYILNLSIKPVNSHETIVPITVFIPFISVENLTCDFFNRQIDYFKAKGEFCTKFPNAGDCLTFPVPFPVNTTIYVKEPCISNLTQDEMNSFIVCRQDLETSETEKTSLMEALSNQTRDSESCHLQISDLTRKIDTMGGSGQVVDILAGFIIFIIICWIVWQIIKKARGQ